MVQNFNIVDGFVVDYMHCVLLGVCKHLCNLWLDVSGDWYIGSRKNDIDRILMSIKPPTNFARTPRSIRNSAQWKASEWRQWLLFYSLFALRGVLPTLYFNHYLLLVESMAILLSESISADDLNSAENCLHAFVSQFGSLYGMNYMTYNVHQLQHIASCVREWGPLWGFSNFMFESSNGFLLTLFNGTQGVSLQICQTFSVYRNIPVMAAKFLPYARGNSSFFQ
jgi:hypothetical protein